MLYVVPYVEAVGMLSEKESPLGSPPPLPRGPLVTSYTMDYLHVP
jgi:hypothetical protein